MTALKVIKIHREASETFKQGLYPSVNSCAKAYNVDKKTLSRMITDNRDYIGGGRQSGIFIAEEESKLLGFVSQRLRLGCGLDFHQLYELSQIFKPTQGVSINLGGTHST